MYKRQPNTGLALVLSGITALVVFGLILWGASVISPQPLDPQMVELEEQNSPEELLLEYRQNIDTLLSLVENDSRSPKTLLEDVQVKIKEIRVPHEFLQSHLHTTIQINSLDEVADRLILPGLKEHLLRLKVIIN